MPIQGNTTYAWSPWRGNRPLATDYETAHRNADPYKYPLFRETLVRLDGRQVCLDVGEALTGHRQALRPLGAVLLQVLPLLR